MQVFAERLAWDRHVRQLLGPGPEQVGQVASQVVQEPPARE